MPLSEYMLRNSTLGHSSVLECLPSMPQVLKSNPSTIKTEELRTQLQLARRSKLNFCMVLFMSAAHKRLI